jgi:hypothetical protein
VSAIRNHDRVKTTRENAHPDQTRDDSLESLLELLWDEPEDDLARVLVRAQLTLIKHPVAARAAFRAVVAEGRRFGETEEGQRWKKRLAGSDLIRRGRSVFELATLGMVNEQPQILPTQFVDMLSYAAGLANLEPALARAVEPALLRATTKASNNDAPGLLGNNDGERVESNDGDALLLNGSSE